MEFGVLREPKKKNVKMNEIQVLIEIDTFYIHLPLAIDFVSNAYSVCLMYVL